MAVLKSFRAIMPTEEMASKVAALPYDVMNSEEAREMVKGNPYSFLHVDKAEVDLGADIDIYDERVYLKARENLDSLVDNGICKMDDKPNLYIYMQIMNGRRQTGIVGCASVDDYINNVIKKHEFTRADKENDRMNHVDYCDANTGPIFLTYRGNERINEIVSAWTESHQSVYDFTAGEVRNTVWAINDDKTISEIENIFKGIESLYIADGHHRAASAIRVAKKRREQYPDYTGNEEFNFFLSVLFPDNELTIMDYNRVVSELNGNSSEEFIERIKENFEVYPKGKEQYKPSERHTFGMYLDDNWYELKAKKGTFDENNPLERLDVAILQSKVLEPILGIGDPRADKRIDFIGGIRGLNELEKRCHSDMRVAFAMCPTSVDDLMSIADSGNVMPPKSTWFEPKLLSGLFIHKLS